MFTFKNSRKMVRFSFLICKRRRQHQEIRNFLNPDQYSRFYSTSIYGVVPKSDQQNVQSYLRLIFGINRARAVHICAKFRISFRARVGQISEEKWHQIKLYIENSSGYLLATDLKRALTKRLVHNLKQGSFKAKRFLWGLPVNGQSARVNGKTAKRLLRPAVPKGLTPFHAKTSIDAKKNKKLK
jgi:ribosomal protein S13